MTPKQLKLIRARAEVAESSRNSGYLPSASEDVLALLVEVEALQAHRERMLARLHDAVSHGFIDSSYVDADE